MKNVQKYQLCCSPLMSTLFIVLACHWCLQASTKCKQQKIPVGCVYFNSTEPFSHLFVGRIIMYVWIGYEYFKQINFIL